MYVIVQHFDGLLDGKRSLSLTIHCEIVMTAIINIIYTCDIVIIAIVIT